MNNQRRKTIGSLLAQIDEIKTKIESIHEDANNVWDEEQEAMDCMPENLWESEQYEKMEEAVSNLEDAVYTLDDIISSLDEVIDSLDAARE